MGTKPPYNHKTQRNPPATLFEKGFWGFPGCQNPSTGKCHHPHLGQIGTSFCMVKIYTNSQVWDKQSNKLPYSLHPSFAIFTYPELQVQKKHLEGLPREHHSQAWCYTHSPKKRSKLDLFPSQPAKPALKQFDLLLLPNPSLSWWNLLEAIWK